MKTQCAASARKTILVVDDEPSILSSTRALLEMDNYTVETIATGQETVKRLQMAPAVDLILLDIIMPGMDGFQTIEACRKVNPQQKIVACSCLNDTRTVVRAIQLGALDYIRKPFHKAEFDAVLKRSLAPEGATATVLQELAASCQEQVVDLGNDLFFLAASPAMKQIRSQLELVAKVDVPVFLLGESGVGKEIVARLIHKLSPRAHHPLVKVNCAALPVHLLESELFGYEAGAFTGALHAKPGKFEGCHKGTILLDEIGEMSPVLQAKLLHVLQDGQFARLGGRSNITADVRVLAATNINMEAAIANKTFREDLYYRLNAFTINIPPLRERREEIPFLFERFMDQFSRKYAQPAQACSRKLMDACMQYDWPGNLRELGNFVKRYMVLRDEDLAISELSQSRQHEIKTEAADNLNSSRTEFGLKTLLRDLKDKTESKAIEEALMVAHGNRKATASRLNISYKALLYKIKQYRIGSPRFPNNDRGRPSYTGDLD